MKAYFDLEINKYINREREREQKKDEKKANMILTLIRRQVDE